MTYARGPNTNKTRPNIKRSVDGGVKVEDPHEGKFNKGSAARDDREIAESYLSTLGYGDKAKPQIKKPPATRSSRVAE